MVRVLSRVRALNLPRPIIIIIMDTIIRLALGLALSLALSLVLSLVLSLDLFLRVLFLRALSLAK
jgi:hypothetical protein